MKTNRSYLMLAAAALLSAMPLWGATLTVLPEESIQAKIDAASAGDIVAIFGGIYTEDLTITKAIRLTEVDGEEVTLTGNVTWNGVTNAPPFSGFTVGGAGDPTKGITINNTTGLVLRNIDAKAGAGIKINGGSSVGVMQSEVSAIEQNGGELTTNRVKVTGNFITTINAQKTVAFRTDVGEAAADNLVDWKSKKAWFGYSKCRKFYFDGSNSKVVLVGNEIDSSGYAPVQLAFATVLLSGSDNEIQILNNQIKGTAYAGRPGQTHSSGWIHGNAIHITGERYKSVFLNNYIPMDRQDAPHSLFDAGNALRASASSEVYFANNIVTDANRGVFAPATAIVRFNVLFNVEVLTDGGTTLFDTITEDPRVILSPTFALEPASPCRNAGINDPLFNDLDGTRNDIGPTGGCLYDPDGWTTNNPVVISFEVVPKQLLKGVDTEVTLSAGQAVTGSN